MCSRHHFARFFLANFAALNDVSVISTPWCYALHDSSNSTDLVSDIIAFRLSIPFRNYEGIGSVARGSIA